MMKMPLAAFYYAVKNRVVVGSMLAMCATLDVTHRYLSGDVNIRHEFDDDTTTSDLIMAVANMTDPICITGRTAIDGMIVMAYREEVSTISDRTGERYMSVMVTDETDSRSCVIPMSRMLETLARAHPKHGTVPCFSSVINELWKALITDICDIPCGYTIAPLVLPSEPSSWTALTMVKYNALTDAIEQQAENELYALLRSQIRGCNSYDIE